MIWCAGNEGFWDDLSRAELGFIDLLKLTDSRRRNRRFDEAGLINEPGMQQSRGPDEEGFGLWLDQPGDTRVRKWRNAYLSKTFKEIEKGLHKSQKGLPVYRGENGVDPEEPGYDTPSSYLGDSSDQRTAYNKYGNEGSDSHSDSGQGSEYEEYYEKIPPPDIYGLSTGIVGLRLFPNPYFDKAARAKWDPERFYNDESYYRDPNLVRPFRVGMACAFCHASWHPLNPPTDKTAPSWSNISGNIGAQYLRPRAAFANVLPDENFVYHILDSQPPGTIDTSLIASDNINNPNTMNAVFRLPQRALQAFRNPPELLSESSARLPSIWESPEADSKPGSNDVVPQFWREIFARQGLTCELNDSNSALRYVPRVLLDGSDSIGAWGSLARVYLNIGSYWEQWNLVHQRVLGFTPQRPFELEDCNEHSVYWNASRLRVGPLRDYFLNASNSMPLLATPNAEERIKPITDQKVAQEAMTRGMSEAEVRREWKIERIDVTQLSHGRRVFAQNCIVCHSSIQPESSVVAFFPGQLADTCDAMEYKSKFEALGELRRTERAKWADDGEFFEHDPGKWLQNPTYKAWALDAVERPAFWAQNYLSTDYRIPVTLVKTNASRAMATNAMSGHIWEDFSSVSYRGLPSPGQIEYFNPFAGRGGAMESFAPRHKVREGVPTGGGGPGYYRVPTLLSVWATAPYLHNNSLGLFNNDPSVSGRLKAFDDGIRKLLWPELRLKSSSYNNATAERLEKDHGLIWRTPRETYLVVSAKSVPVVVSRVPIVARLYEKFPWLNDVNPLWLCSAVLLVVAFLLLMVSNKKRRTVPGKLLIGAGLIYGVLYWAANRYPSNSLIQWIPEYRPPEFIMMTLICGGAILLLPLSRNWVRRIGYAAIVGSLLCGFVIYFKAGKLDDLRLGPIPAGTPVNLLANLNSEADPADLKSSIRDTIMGLAEIESQHLADEAARDVLTTKVAPALMKVNKCPDFVMDKGHYFDWFEAMSDADKESLIELLKTF
ncbi:MAG: hypothetical protein U0996_25705 [Planctomycetaceae bacterium]